LTLQQIRNTQNDNADKDAIEKIQFRYWIIISEFCSDVMIVNCVE
jgi:hypothetical protein